MDKPLRDLLQDPTLDQRSLVALLLSVVAGLIADDTATVPSTSLTDAMKQLATRVNGTVKDAQVAPVPPIRAISVNWGSSKKSGVMVTVDGNPTNPLVMITLRHVPDDPNHRALAALIDRIAPSPS